jgi:sugar O-acyltransferase (sialic acid O-acetyltransferase NeuD family)
MTPTAHIILGAGGHAGVLADALLAGNEAVHGFTDRDPARHGATLCGLPVLGDDDALAAYDLHAVALVNGIGSLDNRAPSVRSRIQQGFMSQGWRFPPVIHPNACVSRFAQLGVGVQVMAGCVVQAGARIGDGVILNTRSVIEHDAVVGAWSHVAPGATICGDVLLGEFCHVGAGAVIRQGVVLGARCLIGAGAAVVQDFPADMVLAGVPARKLETKR